MSRKKLEVQTRLSVASVCAYHASRLEGLRGKLHRRAFVSYPEIGWLLAAYDELLAHHRAQVQRQSAEHQDRAQAATQRRQKLAQELRRLEA